MKREYINMSMCKHILKHLAVAHEGLNVSQIINKVTNDTPIYLTIGVMKNALLTLQRRKMVRVEDIDCSECETNHKYYFITDEGRIANQRNKDADFDAMVAAE